MAIFYPDILDQKTAARTFTYGDKDVMLYALGVGMSHDPMDERELAFTYEKDLKVIPTARRCWPRPWGDPRGAPSRSSRSPATGPARSTS